MRMLISAGNDSNGRLMFYSIFRSIIDSLLKYRKPFHATRWVMLYMKDKVDFFSPTHLQALGVVLLKLSNLHNGLYERVHNMQERSEIVVTINLTCFKYS